MIRNVRITEMIIESKEWEEMARYVKDLVLNKPDDFVQFIMNDFLQKNSFVLSDWKGEPAYRTGDAMMEGYKYLKWNYAGGIFHLEAWMKGTFGGEWNLDGFVGTFQKKPYKASLEQLFAALSQPIPMNQQAAPGQPVPGVVPVHTVDNSNAATMGLVFGIFSLIFAFLIPLVSIILACLGYSRARMGAGSRKAGLAKAGKILCIIGIIAAFIMWGVNVMLAVSPLAGGIY